MRHRNKKSVSVGRQHLEGKDQYTAAPPPPGWQATWTRMSTHMLSLCHVIICCRLVTNLHPLMLPLGTFGTDIKTHGKQSLCHLKKKRLIKKALGFNRSMTAYDTSLICTNLTVLTSGFTTVILLPGDRKCANLCLSRLEAQACMDWYAL